MRYRTVVIVSAPLTMLAIVIAGITVAGCQKRTGGETEKQTAANEDRQTATDAGKQPPASPGTQPSAGGEKQTTQPAAGAKKQPPAVGETPSSTGSGHQTAGEAPAAADTAGNAAAPTPAKEVGGSKYVGVATCSMCHKGAAKGSVYEVWLASPHAKAYEKLGPENQKNDVCLACHTTGYDKPLAANVTPLKMVNVQCEACHGPGSEYKTITVMKNRPEALEKGLVLPTKDVCLRCHGGRFPEGHPTVAFNYESALRKIEHHGKPIEPAK